MPQELTTSREAEILKDCQKGIDYHFRQPELLRAALTHTSGADTRLASNERLEFLLDAAKLFILRYMGPEIEEVAEGAHAGNYKSFLQQVAQREYNATPQYHLLDEKGPDHSKCFKIAAVVGRRHFAAAWGRNKKEAE